MSNPTYYEILKVSESVSQDRIKKAFRRQAKRCHPDQAEGMSQEEAKRQFIRVREAFDVLGDPESRAAYDKGRSHGTENNSADKYEEEWDDFNEAPDQTIGEILGLVAEAGRGLANEAVSVVWRVVSYAFTYGLLLSFPATFIIFQLASGDAPESAQGFLTLLGIVLGIAWGVILGGVWGLFVYMYEST